MTRKIQFLLLFFGAAAGAFAAPVTEAMARAAAERWSDENRSAFGGMGVAVGAVGECDADGVLLWWMVRMSNGGAVVAAPDTGIEPVVTAIPEYDGDLPANHPLRALLTRDMKSRLAMVSDQSAAAALAAKARTAQSTSTSQARVQAVIDKAETKWARLAPSKTSRAASSTIRSGNPAFVVGLAKGFEANGVCTHWNQAGGVYNLYTPNNHVAGCVATAGAALLQYFGVTKAPDPRITRTCYVGDPAEAVELTTMTGAYDWTILPKELGGEASGFSGTLSVEQKDLLSRASHDMGVCVRMAYAAGGSGAFLFLLTTALRDVYGFSDARFVQHPGTADYEKLIYAQTRCSTPVLLGISGTAGGHAVLAVGYGEDADGAKYTRVFLGWGGARDAWYCLPEIDSHVDANGNATATFSVIDEVGTMLGATKDVMPLYGRVTDQNGRGIGGARIEIPDLNKSVRTDADGFWGVRADPSVMSFGWSTKKNITVLCSADGVATNGATASVGRYIVQKKKQTMNFNVSFDGVTTETVTGCYCNGLSDLCNALPGAVDFTVDVPEQTADGIPTDWLREFPSLVAVHGTDFEKAANERAANGKNTYGECYIAGLTPTNATERFEATIAMDADGKPAISWTPDLNRKGELDVRTYTVEQLAFENGALKVVKSGPGVSGSTVTPSDDPSGAKLFRVKVELK